MPPLIPRPGGGHAEDAPPDCEACDLAWPFDGTPDRVLVGTTSEGTRTYTCAGCGHVTYGATRDDVEDNMRRARGDL